MAGGSSYCDEYSRELRTHASDRIRMLEWVWGETLDELPTHAMIFVLPSDLEELSLALLDAMGAGLCVLTSDVPENREVRSRRTGCQKADRGSLSMAEGR
jgi:glycosyltransferase involved in cell wall biosynthesis